MKKNQTNTAMNRRDFLRAGVVTGGAAVALGGTGEILKGITPDEIPQDLRAISADVRMAPNMMTPSMPVIHDPKACIGCNTCVTVCHQGIMVPNPSKGRPPIVLWPDECFACGVCVWFCPQGLEARAITQNHPINQRVRWKRKATGEHFRIGMSNPPEPNTRPPVGGWKAHS
jgi:NAD-dependent dihydropyrimidine dehydrogenase PreA subunit